MNSLQLVLTLVILFQAGGASISEDTSCRKPLTCISLSECMTKHRNHTDLTSGIIFDCGMGPKGRKVCCPPVKTTRPLTGKIKPATPKPVTSVATRAENMKLLPTLDCGLTSAERISEGENATLGQFPWMTLLGYKVGGSSTTTFLCAGTLINNRYVLTAAHCINSNLVSVRLGETNIDTAEDCSNEVCSDPVRNIDVEKVVVHPSFNVPFTLKNDIALVRLKNTVAPLPTDYVRPICLPFGFSITGAEEKKYHIAGWGKLKADNENASSVLKFAVITSSSIEDCNTLQSTRVHTLTDNQLCGGGATGEDACKGDSGGPLMGVKVLPQRETPQWIQLGIVSFGLYKCGSQNAPSVYTRVSAYLDWIVDNIAQ